jgi:hypothetical protein
MCKDITTHWPVRLRRYGLCGCAGVGVHIYHKVDMQGQSISYAHSIHRIWGLQPSTDPYTRGHGSWCILQPGVQQNGMVPHVYHLSCPLYLPPAPPWCLVLLCRPCCCTGLTHARKSAQPVGRNNPIRQTRQSDRWRKVAHKRLELATGHATSVLHLVQSIPSVFVDIVYNREHVWLARDAPLCVQSKVGWGKGGFGHAYLGGVCRFWHFDMKVAVEKWLIARLPTFMDGCVVCAISQDRGVRDRFWLERAEGWAGGERISAQSSATFIRAGRRCTSR